MNICKSDIFSQLRGVLQKCIWLTLQYASGFNCLHLSIGGEAATEIWVFAGFEPRTRNGLTH